MIRCKKIDKFGLIFLAVILTISGINGQELDPCKFFPLNEGDYWQYSVNGGTRYYEYQVLRNSVGVDGTKYAYLYENDIYANDPSWGIDTNYNVYLRPLRSPELHYKLNANLGDSWVISTYDSVNFNMARVVNISSGSYLGKETIFKEISYYYYFLDIDSLYHEYEDGREVLAYGIGLVLQTQEASYPDALVGAIVGSDTLGNIVGTENPHNVPVEFQVYQNYPNPFNPTTRINYTLPELGEIKIKLFNLLGQTIETLYEGLGNTGLNSCYVDFSKINNLASGSYIYGIYYNKKVKFKKMIYLK